jgi:NAD(P)-dependent dehydrogenase (short-subunit alcohol dehydrogenase family)
MKNQHVFLGRLGAGVLDIAPRKAATTKAAAEPANHELSGKVALVTGGSRGVGAATARALAAAGADVAISFVAWAERAVTVANAIKDLGVRSAAFNTDHGDREQVEKLVARVVERFGRLDILVNNAAITISGKVDELDGDVAEFDRQMAINLGGVVTATRQAAQVMRDGGRIITVGSSMGAHTPYPGLADYAATQAAITAYTRATARDLAARRITANVVQTGFIGTDLHPLDRALEPRVALGRFGEPEEVAAAIAFLASPRASYITGTVLTVDGGYSA